MKIYKITEASDYLGVSINTLKTLATPPDFTVREGAERRKISLKTRQANLMEFKKEVTWKIKYTKLITICKGMSLLLKKLKRP